MDRPVSTTGALPPGLDDASPSGWDPHTVWRERVRDPQLKAQRSVPATKVVVADRPTRWNPLDTLRLRGRPLRKTPA